MSPIVRKRSLLSALALFCVGLLLWLFPLGIGSDIANAVGGAGRADLTTGSDSFSISGNTTLPISPGVTVPLDLGFSNPHDFALRVSQVRVELAAIKAPNRTRHRPCTTADFAVRQAPTGLTLHVAAHATGSLSIFHVRPGRWPRVGMLDSSANQDGCKGATLILDYTAYGAREDR